VAEHGADEPMDDEQAFDEDAVGEERKLTVRSATRLAA
jgi:hypothetical protein